MKQRQNNSKLSEEAAYITGLALESVNRVANILGKAEPVNRGIIYNVYRIGRLLRWLR